jgi:hypothetical protein
MNVVVAVIISPSVWIPAAEEWAIVLGYGCCNGFLLF